jgi:hypothetical protein
MKLQNKDNWKDKSTLVCKTCIYFVEKMCDVGRCRFNPPVVVNGWPVVMEDDWCGQHKLDVEKMKYVE